MSPLIAGPLAISIYIAGTTYQSLVLSGRIKTTSSKIICLIGAIALLAQLFTLNGQIFAAEGINLGFLNMASLIAWFVTGITVFSAWRKPMQNLLVVLYPVTALIVAGSVLINAPFIPAAHHLDAGVVGHIVSSIIAFSLITIAAIQAFFLGLQEWQLKHKHTVGIIDLMPPLQSMEALLFQLIWIGMAFLTLSIITGIIFVDNFFGQHLAHKTVFTFLTWGIFAILLWGRYHQGWSSLTIIRWTIGGYAALILGYFGSKFVLEILLHKA